MRIELQGFEYFDARRQRWTRARYKATREDIAQRYPLHRLVGEPEVREVEDDLAKRLPTKPI